MNKILFLFSLSAMLFLVQAIRAQDTTATAAPADTSYWDTGGEFSLTFNQVALANWAAGGENSLALSGFLVLYANYNKERISWENKLDLGYGFLQQGDGEDREFRKNDDRLNFSSVFGYELSGPWYWTTTFDLKTQFDRVIQFPEDSVISRFFAPAYFLINTGLEYKPNKHFNITYSPLNAKLTVVRDDNLAAIGAYGVDPGDNFRAELGSYVRAFYGNEIFTNVNLETKLELFTGYLDSQGEIDVNWETKFNFKINKFLSANVFTHLIYDEDIRFDVTNDAGEVVGDEARVQFKEVFGLGLSLKF
jgi:hypothetical protein